MTDNLPLLAILALALFVGGFLTGFGMCGWLGAPEWPIADPPLWTSSSTTTTVDESQEAGA